MLLWLEVRPVNLLAAQYPVLENAFVQGILEEVGDSLEVLAGFVGDAPLGATSIVSGKAIAAATAGKGVKKVHAFGQFAQTQIEKASAMPIHEEDAETGKRSQ